MIRLVTALMLMLTLAGSLLVSAGSAHHEADTADQHVSVSVQADDHDHKHGVDWAPTLGQRLRPAATVTLLSIVPLPRESSPIPATPVPAEDASTLLRI